ncbi:MAG: radical SAM protein [Spirochaetes bacterium]|nr:radical SAM protein [Spirochaetota bacterium]
MDITLTLKCNNNCVFCPRKDYLKTIACTSLKEAYNDIRKMRLLHEEIVLSGGEVTLLDELPAIISFCQELGFKNIGIITNGRPLKNIKLAEKYILAGVKDFAVSIYSVDDTIHDLITRNKGSGQDSKRGLANLLRLSVRYPINIRVNIVLNYWNHKDINNTLKALYAAGVRNFILAEQVIMRKKDKHLSLEQITRSLAGIRTLKLNNTRLVLRGFPLCLPETPDRSVPEGLILKEKDPLILLEKHEVDTLIKERSRKQKYLKKFEHLFVKVKKCRNCDWKNNCKGFQKLYLEKPGKKDQKR